MGFVGDMIGGVTDAIGLTGGNKAGSSGDLSKEKAEIAKSEAFQKEIGELKTASAERIKRLQTQTEIMTDAIKAA